MHLSHTHNVALIALLTLIGALSSAGFMLWKTSTMADVLTNNVQTIANAEYLRERTTLMEQSLQETTALRASLDAYVLHTDADTIAFLEKIEALATNQGLVYTTKELKEEAANKSPFGTLLVSFTVSGGDAVVMDFITTLETLPFHSTLRTLTIQRSNDTGVLTSTADGILGVSIMRE